MSSAGRKLLSSLVYSGDVGAVLRMDLFPGLFKESEGVLFDFISTHLSCFGVIPAQDTIEEKVGDVLVEATEPPEYYLQELEKRYLQGRLKKLLIEATESLNDQDPDKAFASIVNQVSELNMQQKRRSMIDFREIADLIHAEYMATKKGDDGHSMFFGWPTLDNMTGGLKGGDFCSIVGRPASGKTFMGLYNANHAWGTNQVPLFVSMEMTNLAIGQRLASMSAHKPLTHLLKGMLTTKAHKALMTTLEANKQKDKPFWLVDGNLTTTIDELILLCRQLQPSAVFVDGAYLMRHPNPRIGRFEKQTENAEWLKQRVATDLHIPVVASYQLNREVAKKKKKDGDKAGVEDIYGSDAIGQLSTIVLGLFEEESIETQKRRKVDILKGRNGETGDFLINWDFFGMDFGEIASKKNADGKTVEATESLQFLG